MEVPPRQRQSSFYTVVNSLQDELSVKEDYGLVIPVMTTLAYRGGGPHEATDTALVLCLEHLPPKTGSGSSGSV